MNKERKNSKERKKELRTDEKIRLYNIRKLLHYHRSQFESDDLFIKELKNRIISLEPNASEIEVGKRVNYIQNQVLAENKGIGTTWQNRFELMFGLRIGSLDSPVIEKKVVYVLVSCAGKDAQLIHSTIVSEKSKWHIVDECILVGGSFDLVLRLYGTEQQLSDFLTKKIYSIPKVNIQRTNTLFSFREYKWERYPMRDRVHDPSPPYWLSSSQDVPGEEK